MFCLLHSFCQFDRMAIKICVAEICFQNHYWKKVVRQETNENTENTFHSSENNSENTENKKHILFRQYFICK